MKPTAFLLFLAASVAGASAQSKPATHSAKPSTTTHTTAGHPASAARTLPGKIPAIHGVVKTEFSLKVEDYKIGTGKLAEQNKLYHVLYTGYLASTGEIFDSSEDHREPVMKDGKPVMGADGKPQLGEPQPLVFPQGYGRLIPGFDQGFDGMHIGGKRRIFIPWQLGYGMRDIPAHGEHPGIPPKSDLIFDVELVDVTDMPQMPAHPMGMPPHPGTPSAPAQPARPGAPAAPAQPEKPATPPAGSAPGTPPPSSQPQSK